MNSQLANSVKASRRKMIRITVRKSSRIKDTVVTPPNRGLQNKDPMIEEVTITDSEEEEEQYDFEEDELPHPMSTLIEENIDDKIDYLILLLEAQGKKLDTLVSKVTITNSSHGEGSEMTYKGLYMDSQRKNEALTAENCELTMKLTITESKIEMLMSNPQHLADLAGKVRDIVMLDLVPTLAFNAISSQDAVVHVLKTEHKRGKYQRK